MHSNPETLKLRTSELEGVVRIILLTSFPKAQIFFRTQKCLSCIYIGTSSVTRNYSDQILPSSSTLMPFRCSMQSQYHSTVCLYSSLYFLLPSTNSVLYGLQTSLNQGHFLLDMLQLIQVFLIGAANLEHSILVFCNIEFMTD